MYFWNSIILRSCYVVLQHGLKFKFHFPNTVSLLLPSPYLNVLIWTRRATCLRLWAHRVRVILIAAGLLQGLWKAGLAVSILHQILSCHRSHFQEC